MVRPLLPSVSLPPRMSLRGGRRRGFAQWLLLLGAILGLLASPLAWAAEVMLEVSARQVTLDDELSVQIKASGDFDEVTPPLADGFELQESGRNTQVSIVNGRVSRLLVLVWTAKPTRAGTHTIGPVELKANGRAVARSGTESVQVLTAAQSAPVQSVTEAMNLAQYVGQRVFVRPVVSHPKPYVGQTFEVRFELLWSSRERILSLRNTAEPKVEGQDAEDLKVDAATPQSVEFAGRPYKSQQTHRLAITPLRPGKLRITAPVFRAELGDYFEARALRVAGVTLEVDVQPLPQAGRPDHLDPAAIGKLTLRAEAQAAGKSAQQLQVQPGERILLTYEVSGRGNLGGIRPIAPPELPNMQVEALPGRVDEGILRDKDGVQSGKRTFQYMLSFSQPGRYTIPKQDWSAFDPDTRAYQTSSTPAMEVVVSGTGEPAAEADPPAAPTTPPGGQPAGKTAPAAPAGLARSGEWAGVLASLRPLATDAGLSTAASATSTTPAWVWWTAFGSWMGACGLLASAFARKRLAQRDRLRQRDAALDRAKAALTGAAGQGPDAGYAAIRTAVFAWLAEAGDAPFVTSEGQARAALQARQIPAEQISALCNLLSHCEYARFAPGGASEQAVRETAERVAEQLGRIDPLLRAPRAATTASWALGALAILLALLAPMMARAATLDDAFAAAKAAQSAGQDGEAVRRYQDILHHGVASAAVHYNLAAALVATGHAGEAVAHYQHALALNPDAALRGDVEHNLKQLRSALAERARRKHTILHIFDETPGVDEWLAAAAPRSILAGLVVVFGLGLLVSTALALRDGRPQWRWAAAAALAGQLLAFAWLLAADRVRETVHRGVVVHEDATLQACTGAGEPMDLPEGLGLRILSTTADGRLVVRLGSGREGCLPPEAVYKM